MRRKNFVTMSFCLCLAPVTGICCTYSQSPARIDIVGDSHTTQAFGEELQKDLETSGDAPGGVFRFAVAGSTAGQWAYSTNELLRKLTIRSYCPGDGDIQGAPALPQFPTLGVLMSQRPLGKALLVALGTNDMMAKCRLPVEQQMADIEGFLNEIPSQIFCVWIGPASMTSGAIVDHCGLDGMQTFVQLLKEALAKKCQFVDSREFRAPAGLSALDAVDDPPHSLADCTNPSNVPLVPNKGFHFIGALAHFWGDCVALKVQSFAKPASPPVLR